jgi:dienelactone hydrolase
MMRRDHTFLSGGQRCAARLHTPDGADAVMPCVVMAHGFDGAGTARLEPFAQRFAAEGVATLVFDYRHFGDSEGEPRGLLDLTRQLDDWRAAVTFARMLEEIDSRRIALWGTSLSAGHVVTVAVEDPELAAAISQAPFVDGLRYARSGGFRTGLRRALAEEADGTPGAQALARLAVYRPGVRAPAIPCPWMVCVCDQDRVVPPGPALKAAARAPQGEIRHYEAGHYDIYGGPTFEMAAGDQVDFLRRHLLPED